MMTQLSILADILLAAGAVGAGLYCLVLSRRLKKFTDLENGVGGAVAVLAVQVNDLEKSLDQAKSAASLSVNTLSDVNKRAEASARKLELLIASLHDISPEVPPVKVTKAIDPFFVRDAKQMAAAE